MESNFVLEVQHYTDSSVTTDLYNKIIAITSKYENAISTSFDINNLPPNNQSFLTDFNITANNLPVIILYRNDNWVGQWNGQDAIDLVEDGVFEQTLIQAGADTTLTTPAAPNTTIPPDIVPGTTFVAKPWVPAALFGFLMGMLFIKK